VEVSIEGNTRKMGDEDEGGSEAKSLEGEQTVTDTPSYCSRSTNMKIDTKSSQ
jgi:hypothetical protein